MEEQFNKETNQECSLAADAARVTEDSAGSEECNLSSGTVVKAIDSDLGAVIDKEQGAGHERRIAQAWVNVRGGMRVFAVYIWRRRCK